MTLEGRGRCLPTHYHPSDLDLQTHDRCHQYSVFFHLTLLAVEALLAGEGLPGHLPRGSETHEMVWITQGLLPAFGETPLRWRILDLAPAKKASLQVHVLRSYLSVISFR